MKIIRSKVLTIIFLFTAPYTQLNCQVKNVLHKVKVESLEDLQDYFTYNPDADIIISAHRGGMLPGYPENCIESCEKTLAYLPSFFEIDPRLTKDSVMILMHDADITRTTNGEGLVSDYTYEELQQFKLRDNDGNITPYKIPTIVEMFEWGKDKTVFNLDNKDNGQHTWDYYIRQLKEGGEWHSYKNLILSVRSLDEAMYYWRHGINDRMFCVEISSKEHFEAYNQSLIPWSQIMAYIRFTVNPQLEELYRELHNKGVSIMTAIAPTADKIANKSDRRVAYLRELLAMPDIIETDFPFEFVDLPRSKEELDCLRKNAMNRIEY